MANPASESYAAFGTVEDTARIEQFLGWLAARRGLETPIRVLDVGCGTGRMFASFRALGWHVASMEPDVEFHEAATVAAVAAGYGAPERGGFLEIQADGTFDLVTAINDPFAHMLTADDKRKALARVRRALRPHGVVLIDVPNFLWILKHYRAPAEMRAELPDAMGEVSLRREHVIDYHDAVFTTIEHYDVVRHGEHHSISKRHAYAMSTQPELHDLFAQSGFGAIETYGSWNAREAERVTGARLILSAVRV